MAKSKDKYFERYITFCKLGDGEGCKFDGCLIFNKCYPELYEEWQKAKQENDICEKLS